MAHVTLLCCFSTFQTDEEEEDHNHFDADDVVLCPFQHI